LSCLRSPHLALLSIVTAAIAALLYPYPTRSAHEPGSRLDDAIVVPLCALVDQGSFAEAENAILKLLPEIEAEWGRDSLEAADLLDVLTEARWRGGKAGDAATLDYANRALQIRQRHLGLDHPLVADSMVEKASVLHQRGKYRAAEKLLERALPIYKRAYGPGDTHVAMVLNNLGTVYMDLGELDNARVCLEQAIELYEEQCGGDCFLLTGTLGNLAGVLSDMGDYARAQELLRRELWILDRTVGLQDPRAVGTLANLGLNLYEQGKYLEASVLMQRAVASRTEVLGPENPRVAESLINLAGLEADLGYVSQADTDYELGVSILEHSLGPRHPDFARALVNYGAFLESLDLVRARAQFERALEIFGSVYGEDHPLTAWTHTSLGRALTRTGDWVAAEENLLRALEFWERSPTPVEALRIGAVAAMGRLQADMGDLVAARDSFAQVLELELDSHGAHHAHVAGARASVAELSVAEGSFDEAEDLLRAALATVTRTVGTATAAYAKPLVLLGDVEFGRGNWVEALGHYREAVTTLEIIYAGPTSETAELRLKIARCLAKLGAQRPATVAALQAEDISRAHLRLLLTGMSESEGLRYASTRSSGLDVAFSLVLGAGEADLAEAAVDSLIRSRALVLDEIADRWREVTSLSDPELEKQVGALDAARRRLAYLVVRGPQSSKQLAGYTAALEVARRERDEAERSLALASREQRLDESRRGTGLDEVIAALPSGSALVGFARVAVLDLESEASAAGKEAGGKPSYVAYVVSTHDPSPAVIMLGYATELDELVERLQRNIAQEVESLGVGDQWSEGVYRRDAELLRRRVWDPVAGRVGNVERLFIVPDGALHLVNYAALPAEDGAYLIEIAPKIHYLSAERDLVLEQPDATGEGLLALGSPDFDARAEDLVAAQAASSRAASSRRSSGDSTRGSSRNGCEDLDSLQFQTLPSADVELNRVVGFWRRLGEAESQVVDLRGVEASEHSFRREASGKRVAHLATHGFFLGNRCSSAATASEGGRSRSSAGRQTPAPNPLLQSGLALAGANRHREARPEEDDGILTAEEIAGADLQGIEWAVLSACESGLGQVQAGEGVLGLRRAFRVAGARTLIVSLWQVEDESTLEWMSTLYRHRFVEGASTIDAVHQASLELLETRRQAGLSTHPYYWAGFVATGDWR